MQPRGRSAPWARVLGALLLAPLCLIVAYVVTSNVRESTREERALAATHQDARRYADTVMTRLTGQWPADHAQLRTALADTAGKGRGDGTLLRVRHGGNSTHAVALFSRRCERVMPLFGPADAMASRRYAFEFPHSDAAASRARITAEP